MPKGWLASAGTWLRIAAALALTLLGAWIGSALFPDWLLDTWGRPCGGCMTYLGCLMRCISVGPIVLTEGIVTGLGTVLGIVGGLAVGALADTVIGRDDEVPPP